MGLRDPPRATPSGDEVGFVHPAISPGVAHDERLLPISFSSCVPKIPRPVLLPAPLLPVGHHLSTLCAEYDLSVSLSFTPKNPLWNSRVAVGYPLPVSRCEHKATERLRAMEVWFGRFDRAPDGELVPAAETLKIPLPNRAGIRRNLSPDKPG